MKKIFLVCSNIVVLALFLIVASKNNSKFVDLDEKDYSRVFKKSQGI